MTKQSNADSFKSKLVTSGCLSGCFTLMLVMIAVLLGIVGICILALAQSAFEISTVLGIVTSIGIAVALMVYFIYFIPQIEGKKDYIQGYTNLQVLMAIFGFVQVFFWMIKPENPFNEPRSVFIVGVSAFLAYLKVRVVDMMQRRERDSLSLKMSKSPPIPID